jgi:hypothetical protein
MVKNEKGGFVFRVPERMRNIGIAVLCCVTLAAVFVDVALVHVRPVQAQGYRSGPVYVQILKGSDSVGFGDYQMTPRGQNVVGFACVSEGTSSYCYVASR